MTVRKVSFGGGLGVTDVENPIDGRGSGAGPVISS